MVSTHMRGAVIPTSFHNGFPRASILRVWHTVPRFAFTTNQSKGTVRHIVKIMAISMIEDEEGFEYPQIDEKKCIKCYQCLKVCPFKET